MALNAEQPRSEIQSAPGKNTPRRHRSYFPWIALPLWFALMAPLAFWGLPSSKQDHLLYSGEPPWAWVREHAARTAQQLQTRPGGADTDLDPLAARDQIIDLTADESARAAILLRYRLYSRQPDEMITFRALQRMKPRQFDFDPKLYQYGGGYIYLIGAALGASSLPGITRLTGDIGFYLEHPGQFARFYIVARCVTLLFGAFLLLAVYRLTRRIAGAWTAGAATICVACCPVFITGALEAKPHLPSACLTLWAILSALDYHAHGRRRDALKMGLQAGYAMGLVLTGVAALFLWPALLLTRGRPLGGGAYSRPKTPLDLAFAGLLTFGVYCATNPFVPYNLLFNRGALTGNLTNSTDMYSIGRFTEGGAVVVRLLLESAGPLAPLCGIAGFVWFLRKKPRETLLAAAPGAALLALCVALGAGKPAEFARFLLLPTVLLVIACAWAAAHWRNSLPRYALVALGLSVAGLGLGCAWSFFKDAWRADESRAAAAAYLHTQAGPRDIGVLQEPAPYAVPPLDFTRDRVRLLPRQTPRDVQPAELPQWLVFTADDEQVHQNDWWREYYKPDARFPARSWIFSGRIPWADKPVFVYRRNVP